MNHRFPENTIATHLNLPLVLRREANFLIMARISPSNLPKQWEQLWCRKISDKIMKICCIPFCLYDVALGDEVEIISADGHYLFSHVTVAQGHRVFRAFLSGNLQGERDELVRRLDEMNCLWEWYHSRLIAIDTPDGEQRQAVENLLIEFENDGHLVYEHGFTK